MDRARKGGKEGRREGGKEGRGRGSRLTKSKADRERPSYLSGRDGKKEGIEAEGGKADCVLY